jgi:hypothetical protein
MKTLIGFLIGLAVLLAGIAIRYFLLRQREKRAQREGVAVYATVVGIEPETSRSRARSAARSPSAPASRSGRRSIPA